MKLEIPKGDLINLISKTLNIVEKRNTMPVLVNILLDAQKGKLKAFATNLEVSITDEVEAVVTQQGRVAINAKNLHDIIKELAEGPISLIKQENNWLKITQGRSIFNMVGVSPDEYPVFPTHSTKEFMEIEAKVLAEMIGKTIYSVSNDDTRYHLNGVYFENRLSGSAGSAFLMVATDGHRLSLVNRENKGPSTKTVEGGVIIPRKGLAEIYKLLENEDGKFLMAIEGSQLIVKHKNAIIMIRLIEGKYPNYRQLIPQNLNEHVLVKRDSLLSSLKRVSLLSNQKSKGVTLNFTQGRLEISSNNPELGDAKEEIEIDYNGTGLKIGFNAKYIIDILNSMEKEEDISIDLKDQLSPGVMRAREDKDYTCVIMPMRI
ncbi:MAG: DNA polymerase III subunit beta [Bdellovibrionales bacterium RBG_16_40_8]|nr:MAG: DNA polymerase III subunit beta [Bdellovibrionales bacterium RBG_16_40_8]